MDDDDPHRQHLTAEEWLRETRELERRGEFLRAYDVATRGLAEHPDDVWLRYRAVLVLARAGATRLAAQRYEEYGLATEGHEDIAALRARLAKDLALAEEGPRRARLAAHAADGYEGVYARTHGYFPGINAATMRLVGGEVDRAQALARRILVEIEGPGSAAGEDTYYRLATRAEAQLILDRGAAARASLAEARAAAGADFAALATTRKQLKVVCEARGVDARLLDVLAPPRVIYYCGHMIAAPGMDGRFRADAEDAVAAVIRSHLDREDVGFGYGALGAGADILFAEALIAREAELHVVLPFRRDEFIDTSVRPAGERWVSRFARCLAAARSVRYSTEDSYLGDADLFAYGSQLAMGLAVLRARYLDAPVEQVALWDGAPATRSWGTAADVATWRSLGLAQTIIGEGLAAPTAGAAGPTTAPADTGRARRAMLFGDVKGFSALSERQLPVFVSEVLGRFASVLDQFERAIAFRNTWGDGVFLVFEDPCEAARCGLTLQRAMAAIPLEAVGLPPGLALRLGAHFGPVYRARDPILKTENYFGAHVSRAARIEPVTPEGCVYVTEPFAALLALDPTREFECDYVGHQPAAKQYGELPMYLLRGRR